MYFLYGAPLLHYVYFQRNTEVVQIYIKRCSLNDIPNTVRNLPGLQRLTITFCQLRYLKLNSFIGVTSLKALDVSHNKILFISELPAGSMLHIHNLHLGNNSLGHLNARALDPFCELSCLVLDNNHLEKIVSPFSLPKLKELSLNYNRLSSLDCSDWNMPQLIFFYCGNNRLSNAPIGWRRSLWQINTLDLSFNRLRTFRMDDLYLTQVRVLNLVANELQSVTTSQMHLRIPLERLRLARNQLTMLDISRWGMPKLWELNLEDNRLTELSDLFVRFPSLTSMMILRNNNWSCEWIKRVHLADLRQKHYGCLATNQQCYNADYYVEQGIRICCWDVVQ
ncbi:toll-like receptor 6 [Anopheles nili]|uniref:toll-like receptor 6 n=1 Tax=Anopheles nili TaxID=185578 RepID=UPI00237A1FBA|nr:toll-like receptor 6 [Anopheles nili]